LYSTQLRRGDLHKYRNSNNNSYTAAAGKATLSRCIPCCLYYNTRRGHTGVI
jgi:hypothetical protein